MESRAAEDQYVDPRRFTLDARLDVVIAAVLAINGRPACTATATSIASNGIPERFLPSIWGTLDAAIP